MLRDGYSRWSACSTCAKASVSVVRLYGPKVVGLRLPANGLSCSRSTVQGQTSKSAIVSDTSLLPGATRFEAVRAAVGTVVIQKL